MGERMSIMAKTVSALAVAAATGLFAGSASAADLGGNCCSDLEERVAELEATTARKGNRKMSLQVYGTVSESIVWWDDGASRNVYVLENNNVKNTLGFRGSAKINGDWSAGYRLEMQIRSYRSSAANQLALGASNNVTITAYNTQAISLRHAYWFLKSNTYGTITIGRDVDAATGTSSVSLVNPGGFSGINGPGFAMGGFFMRRAGTTGTNGLSSQLWGRVAFIPNGDGPAPFTYAQTGSNVKYTSPFFLGKTKSSGFQFSTNWGMDDYWAVALRYAEDFGIFRFAAAVGYEDWRSIDRGVCSTGGSTTAGLGGSALAIPGTTGPTGTAIGSTVNCNSIQASASLLHVPTGLYVSGGGGQMEDNNLQTYANLVSTNVAAGGSRQGLDNKHSTWWVQAGWNAKLNSLGSTIFWGQYQAYDTGFGVFSSVAQTVSSTDVLNSIGATSFMSGSQTSIWSLGVTQNIDAAAMQLYLGYHNYSTDLVLMNQSATATNQRAASNPIADFQVIYSGATIRF
jgi:hypothetical protein